LRRKLDRRRVDFVSDATGGKTYSLLKPAPRLLPTSSEIFGLIIARRETKPSRRYESVICNSCTYIDGNCAHHGPRLLATTQTPSKSNPDFSLKFGDPAQKKYIELQKEDDDSDFCAALGKIKSHGGDCDADFESKSKPRKHKHYDCSQPAVCLVTDKVTRSYLAKNAPVAGDPNVMHRVQSNDPTDIINVLNTFAIPTPTP